VVITIDAAPGDYSSQTKTICPASSSEQGNILNTAEPACRNIITTGLILMARSGYSRSECGDGSGRHGFTSPMY